MSPPAPAARSGRAAATAAFVALAALTSATLALATLALATLAPGPAGAAVPTTGHLVPLEPLVMQSPFPGFDEMPPGTLNGPPSASTFAGYSTDPAAAATFRRLAASPGFSAYLREWRDARASTQGMNVVVTLVFRIPDASTRAGFADDQARSLSGLPSTSRWAVPGIPGARGFTVAVVKPVPAVDQVVVFRTGIYVAMVELASAVGPRNVHPFTIAEAVTASYLQYALVAVAPGGGRPVPAGAAGDGAGPAVAAIVAALLVAALGAGTWWLLRQRRSAGQAADAALAAALAPLGAVAGDRRTPVAGATAVPDLGSRPDQPGWLPDPSGEPGRIRYWDGSRWTGYGAVRGD